HEKYDCHEQHEESCKDSGVLLIGRQFYVVIMINFQLIAFHALLGDLQRRGFLGQFVSLFIKSVDTFSFFIIYIYFHTGRADELAGLSSQVERRNSVLRHVDEQLVYYTMNKRRKQRSGVKLRIIMMMAGALMIITPCGSGEESYAPSENDEAAGS